MRNSSVLTALFPQVRRPESGPLVYRGRCTAQLPGRNTDTHLKGGFACTGTESAKPSRTRIWHIRYVSGWQTTVNRAKQAVGVLTEQWGANPDRRMEDHTPAGRPRDQEHLNRESWFAHVQQKRTATHCPLATAAFFRLRPFAEWKYWPRRSGSLHTVKRCLACR